MKNRRLSIRICATVIAAELVVISLGSWVAAGMPGLLRDSGAPSVTIQFTPAPPPASPVRAYKI